MSQKAKTKLLTIYAMEDRRGPEGKIYHADGPAIKEAIEKELIVPDETWEFDIEELIKNLKFKGVK